MTRPARAALIAAGLAAVWVAGMVAAFAAAHHLARDDMPGLWWEDDAPAP